MGQKIIQLYKKFDKYKYVDDESIYYKILPSLRLNQYKSDNETYFYNWAYLNDKAQKEYIETGNIQPFNWRSGNNLWLYDIVILKDAKKVMRKLIDKFKLNVIDSPLPSFVVADCPFNVATSVFKVVISEVLVLIESFVVEDKSIVSIKGSYDLPVPALVADK